MSLRIGDAGIWRARLEICGFIAAPAEGWLVLRGKPTTSRRGRASDHREGVLLRRFGNAGAPAVAHAEHEQSLPPKTGVASEPSPPGGARHDRLALAAAAHPHANVLAIADDQRSLRAQMLHQRVRDLSR